MKTVHARSFVLVGNFLTFPHSFVCRDPSTLTLAPASFSLDLTCMLVLDWSASGPWQLPAFLPCKRVTILHVTSTLVLIPQELVCSCGKLPAESQFCSKFLKRLSGPKALAWPKIALVYFLLHSQTLTANSNNIQINSLAKRWFQIKYFSLSTLRSQAAPMESFSTPNSGFYASLWGRYHVFRSHSTLLKQKKLRFFVLSFVFICRWWVGKH